MIGRRNAQNSVEFMVIFAFVLGLIALVMFVTGKYLVDVQDQENQMKAENFADNINKELTILTQVDGGYYRELGISNRDYEIVNVTPSLLIVNDIYNNETYYFDLIGDYNVSVEERLNAYGYNDTYLIFEKEPIDQSGDGIDLEEIVIVTDVPAQPSNLDVDFRVGTNCLPGYVELYALDGVDNSHAEIWSSNLYTYSVCLSHSSFSLGRNCNAAINATLFYLADVTDSHVYRDNLSAAPPLYPGYYNWQEICVSSSAGEARVVYSTTRPNINYVCVGSVWQDSIYGGMIGDCSVPSIPPYTKIWLSIDNPYS